MGCIALVRCVLVLRCGSAGVMRYPNAGWSTSNQSNTTHEITQQISRKLLRMDVLTSETCWALNNEIIKQVTSNWSLFSQLPIQTIYLYTDYIGKFWEQKKWTKFMGMRCIREKWIEFSLQTMKMTVFWLPAFRRNCLNHLSIYSSPGSNVWLQNTGYCSQNYVASHAKKDYLQNHSHENFQKNHILITCLRKKSTKNCDHKTWIFDMASGLLRNSWIESFSLSSVAVCEFSWYEDEEASSCSISDDFAKNRNNIRILYCTWNSPPFSVAINDTVLL